MHVAHVHVYLQNAQRNFLVYLDGTLFSWIFQEEESYTYSYWFWFASKKIEWKLHCDTNFGALVHAFTM
jgi:hypothetical protein